MTHPLNDILRTLESAMGALEDFNSDEAQTDDEHDIYSLLNEAYDTVNDAHTLIMEARDLHLGITEE